MYILSPHLVICPSLQMHLPDFGQGSAVELSAGDDVNMHDATGESIPLAPFEEAEGDVAYVEAVRQAVADHRYVTQKKVLKSS